MRTIIVASLLVLLAAVACGTETPEGTTKQATPVKATPIIVPSPTVEPTVTPEPTDVEGCEDVLTREHSLRAILTNEDLMRCVHEELQ